MTNIATIENALALIEMAFGLLEADEFTLEHQVGCVQFMAAVHNILANIKDGTPMCSECASFIAHMTSPESLNAIFSPVPVGGLMQ